MRMVPPRVRPVTRLVMIWVTWVPVDTAATLSAEQYCPTTNRSTAPYRDWRTLASKKGSVKVTRALTTLPWVSLFVLSSMPAISCLPLPPLFRGK